MWKSGGGWTSRWAGVFLPVHRLVHALEPRSGPLGPVSTYPQSAQLRHGCRKKAVRHGWRTHLRGISPNFGKRRKAVYAKGVRAFLARVSVICHLTAETDSPLCGSLISAARRLDLRRFGPKLVVQYLGLTVRADRRESLLRKPGFIACQCNRLRIGRCDLFGD